MITAGQAHAAFRALPERQLATLPSTPLLILAPHPDDESLGCGGLIAALCQAGNAPFVLVVTDGAGSHPGSRAYPPARLRRLRAQEASDAVAILGLPPENIGFLGLPDTASPMEGPAFDAAATAIASLAFRNACHTILAPWQHDPHCDHLSAHRLAQAAAAEAGLTHLAYPVWGWTLPEDTPLDGSLPTGFRLDVASHLATKRAAIAAHRSQYAGLIPDDPSGFQLQPGFLALFDQPFETFITL